MFFYLGTHGGAGVTSVKIHGGVVEGVAASFIVGAVAFVAVERLSVRHRNSLHKDGEEEEEEEEEEGVAAEEAKERPEAVRPAFRVKSHFCPVFSSGCALLIQFMNTLEQT